MVGEEEPRSPPAAVAATGENGPKLPPSAEPVSLETAKPLVWLVFGGTGHLGRCIARAAFLRGDFVFTVGKAGLDDNNMEGWHANCHGATCDVRDPESLRAVVEKARACWNRIDVVVNCSGYGVIGACEDQDDYEIRNQMDTNFMGTFNIVHMLVPYFRERGGGRFILFSSTSGFLGLPGLGGYCASKWAVEGFAESVMYELEPFGIKVSLVIPGLAKRDELEQDPLTPLPNIANWGHFLMTSPSPCYSGVNSPANHGRRMVQWVRDKQITSALKVADLVWELAHCNCPPLRFLLGHHAVESMRDRLKFTLEEIEDWKHLYQPEDSESIQGSSQAK